MTNTEGVIRRCTLQGEKRVKRGVRERFEARQDVRLQELVTSDDCALQSRDNEEIGH